MAELVSVKIHPSIGIARLGNHPTEYFVGPERENQFIHEDEINNFKSEDPLDNNILKIKRQACRFRVFGYYDNGDVIELDDTKVDIEWKVKIANTKAISNGFYQIEMPAAELRNNFVKGIDREGLALKPKELSISGKNKTEKFEPCKFKVIEVNGDELISDEIELGEIRTEQNGNLLVFGGFGNSGAVKDHKIDNYVNNDYWYDDTADGYVKAKVTFKETNRTFQAKDAWVIIASPNYVPHIRPIINLYETLFNEFVIDGRIKEIERPLFYRDIYPILKRAVDVKWLHKMNAHTSMGMLLRPNAPIPLRRRLFDKLRKPDGTGGNMPKLFGDKYRSSGRTARLSITSCQYNILKKWVNNQYDIDSIDNLNPSETITANGLDIASLENCVGGAFFPGIETSWFIRDKFEFLEPFRLDSSKIKPGDLTKQNALPWQADFMVCSKEDDIVSPEPNDFVGWWPYSRPDDVFTENENEYKAWTPSNQFQTYEDMVEKWKFLGIVVEKNGKYLEVQREFPDEPNT